MSTERRKENKFIVYTDIVGHTKMFGRVGAAFRQMREKHDELFLNAVRQHAPHATVKGTGDGFYAAMDDVTAAVEAALAFRRSLVTEDWDKLLPAEKRTPENHIKARVGIHSGLVNMVYDDLRAIDFDGQPRSITDKVMSMAVGNQVLVTRQVRDQGQVNLSRRDEMEWKKFGEYKLREVADTVEIWGLGEGDLGIGPKPAQPPEHRVVVFATIHDYSTVVETAGPGYDELKDKWDAAFDAAVAAQAKDTFVKRLPDGSLAAFKNAMDAVRASRDFRRAMKVAMKSETLQLQPKVALDSGLVTFDYEANRAVDVRDQPVNIAAKVCKTGLSAAWQLILSRPVREDAFQNLPEREEYKWVCIGRKAVPGEPEPVELWDFQDIQSKSETRTVMWVDAKNVHDALRVLPHIYARFIARLEELVREMITRRTEEPWILTTEHGIAAAFKDPVEAVAGAIDLRDTATKEEWERFLTGFSRGSRTDNLIRIAVHQGPMRITFEDGQLKEFKGAAVDGVKPVVEAAKNSQILLSRDLKETVGTAFPASEVRWRRVELTVKDPTHPNEAFELRKVKKIPKPVLIGSAVGALLIITLLTLGLIFRGGGGVDPRLKKVAALNTMLQEAQKGAVPLPQIAAKFGELLLKRDDGMKAEGLSDGERNDALVREGAELKRVIDAWRGIDAVQLYGAERATIEKLATLDEFKKWVGEALPKYGRVTDDPRPQRVVEWKDELQRQRVKLAGAGLSRSDWKKRVDELDERVDALMSRPLNATTVEKIKKDSAEIDGLLAEGGELRGGIETAVAERRKSMSADEASAAKTAEEEANRLAAAGELPVEALVPILRLQRSGVESLRAVGAAAERAKLALVAATPGKKPDERGKLFEPLAAELRAILEDQQSIDFVALAQDWTADGTLDKLAKAQGIDEIKSLLSTVDRYRPATGDDPRKAERWTAALRGLRQQLSGEGATDADAEKKIADLEGRVRAIGQLSFIKHNAQRLAQESQAIEGELAADGVLAKRVAAAVAGVREKAKAGEAATAAKREAIQKFTDAVAPASVGSGSAAADRAWLSAADAFRAQRTDDNAGELAKQVMAMFVAIKAAPAAFPAAPKLDGSPWQAELVPIVDRLREGAIEQALGKLDWKAGVKTADIDAAANTGGKAFKQLVDAVERAAGNAKSLQDALEAGAGPAQVAAGRKETVQELAEGLRKSPAMDTPGIRSVFSQLLARFDALAGVGAAKNVDELVAAATRPGASDEVIGTAWRRLGELQPTGEGKWLDQQSQVYDTLQRSGAAPPIKEQAKADRSARWVKHVEALKGAGLETAVSTARLQRAEFGVRDEQIAAMKWPARYNLALAGIQELLDQGADEAALRAGVKAVLDLESGKPAGNDGIRKTFEVLRGLGAGNVGGGEQAVPLSQAGPAAMKEMFEFVGEGAGDAPVYAMKLQAGKKQFDSAMLKNRQLEFKSTSLTFRRVVPKAGETAGKTVYLSTTEVSAGMAIELLRREPGRVSLGSFSAKSDAFPRVWSHDGERLRIGASARETDDKSLFVSWLHDPGIDPQSEKYFPPSLRAGKVSAPSPDHPMQYVSVVAAMCIAKLAGCRLPTSGEWQAALEAEPGWQDPTRWNLRGPSMDEFIRYRRENKTKGPGGWDADLRTVDPLQSAPCGAVPEDGTLWFDKVGESKAEVFKHLIGNAGEWVFEKPGEVASLKASDVRPYFEPDARRASVATIGGSWASCVTLAGGSLDEKITKPVPLPPPEFRVGKGAGFVDVGFRLAFTPTVAKNEESGASYRGELAEKRKQFVYAASGS